MEPNVSPVCGGLINPLASARNNVFCWTSGVSALNATTAAASSATVIPATSSNIAAVVVIPLE